MAADLDPIHLRAHMIGLVDHPVRQPQEALLYGLQMLNIGGHDIALFWVGLFGGVAGRAGQGLIQICQDILDLFKSDGQTDQPVTYAM